VGINNCGGVAQKFRWTRSRPGRSRRRLSRILLKSKPLKPQKPRLDASLAFDFDGTARLEDELVLELLINSPRHLNRVRDAARFHAASEVYRIAPEIIDVLALSQVKDVAGLPQEGIRCSKERAAGAAP
jgi:hypothetical protein